MPDGGHGETNDHGDGGRGTDNLDPIDNVLGDDPDETMQTGYSPPDREPRSLRDAPTRADMRRGQSVEGYLREEEPDVGDPSGADDENSGAARGLDDTRAGRLIAPPDDDRVDAAAGPSAVDPGPAGYASTAEEAAMHVADSGDRRP